MRATLLAAFLVALATTPAHAVRFAYWSFDEAPGQTVAADGEGSADGTLAGDAAFVSGGVSGNAMNINNSVNSTLDGLVNMGHSVFALGRPFSIATWVKTSSGFSDSNIMLGKHQGGSLNGYFLGMNTSAGYGLPDKAYFYVSTGPGGEAISTTDVNDGEWHLVVGTIDGAGVLRIYVDDGPAEATVGAGLNPGANFAPFQAGGINSSPTSVFTGMLDEAALFDTALSQSEVEALFSSVPEPGVAWLLALGLLGLGLPALRRRLRSVRS